MSEVSPEHDTYHTDSINCPHCGEKQCSTEEGYNNDDEWTQECDDCGEKFKVSVEVEVSFTTEKLPDPTTQPLPGQMSFACLEDDKNEID